MTALTALTKGGFPWIPQFIESLDITYCLGCARCLKVCGRGVFALKALNEDGEFVEDEEDEESERKVMTIVNAALCIGCQACSRICPKQCHTYAPQAT
ncbi:MAG: ferredoxin III, nif-specific [Thermostichus sp. DG02_5_bins_236]